MIEQNQNQLIMTFPTEQAATDFKTWMQMAALPWLPLNLPVESPPSEPSPEMGGKSRHVMLTPERQDQLTQQRLQGQTAHQRLVKAQTMLRDGTLPFKQLPEAPQPSSQPSPRIKAQQEGGFADGEKKSPRQSHPATPQPKPNDPTPENSSAKSGSASTRTAKSLDRQPTPNSGTT